MIRGSSLRCFLKLGLRDEDNDKERVMAKRKQLSKKIRFDVFKRDSFTCQYCGQVAPTVILQVDHIEPVSKGGKNDLLNLITSCIECNSGKGNRRLSENSALTKRQRQASEINARRELIEMIAEWHTELHSLENLEISKLESILCGPGFFVTEGGKKKLRALINKFGFSAVVDACFSAIETYEVGTLDQREDMFSKISGICACKADPTLAKAVHIRNIIKKYYRWYPFDATKKIQHALNHGLSYEDGKNWAWNCRCWDEFEAKLLSVVGER